jgi:hypothetical protein
VSAEANKRRTLLGAEVRSACPGERPPFHGDSGGLNAAGIDHTIMPIVDNVPDRLTAEETPASTIWDFTAMQLWLVVNASK